MKKLLLLLCALICLSFPNISVVRADELPQSVRVITVSTRIYNLPSLSNPMLNGEEEVRAQHDDVFNVLSMIVEENTFYEIEFNESSAYILKAHVLDTKVNSSNVKLDFNATLIEDVSVYELVEDSYNKVDITLLKGTRIKLLDGLDTSKEYTRASFEIDEQTLTYYMPTSSNKADGMSATGITAIALIITCTSLLIILFGFKGDKKKKKEK